VKKNQGLYILLKTDLSSISGGSWSIDEEKNQVFKHRVSTIKSQGGK